MLQAGSEITFKLHVMIFPISCFAVFLFLTISWWRSLSYRDQSIDLVSLIGISVVKVNNSKVSGYHRYKIILNTLLFNPFLCACKNIRKVAIYAVILLF